MYDAHELETAATNLVAAKLGGMTQGTCFIIMAIARRFGSGIFRGFPHLGAFRSYFWISFIRGVRTYRILNDIKYGLKASSRELLDKFGWKDYLGKHHEPC